MEDRSRNFSNSNVSNSSLKTKNPSKKKRRLKMLSSFSILLIIIALLIFISWILNWAGVKVDVTTNQTKTLGFSLKDSSGSPGIYYLDNRIFNGIFASFNETSEQSELFKVLNEWFKTSTGQSFEFSGFVTRVDSITKSTTVKPLGFLDILSVPIQGFIRQANIIVFLLVIGGFIYIVVQSKALESFSQSILWKLKGREIWAIIPLMLFFAFCGSVEGLSEETLGFYVFSIPLMLLAGFDVMTGFLVVFLGAGIGVVGSTVVPFSIVAALNALNTAYQANGGQGELLSIGNGLVWRFVTWFVVTGSGIGFVCWHAYRVKKNPQLLVTFKTYEADKKFFLSSSIEKVEMTWKRKVTLAVFILAYILMVVYLINWDEIFGIGFFKKSGDIINQKAPWITGLIPGLGQGSLVEVTAFFLLGGIFLGIVNGLGEEKFLKEFMTGAADLISVTLVVGTASGIAIVLEKTHMQNLVLSGLSSAIGGIQSDIGKVLVLFLIFIPISFLIPSTSGFAAAIFPLLLEVVAVKNGDGEMVARNVVASGSIAAFVHANGWVNLFTPTSGVLLGGLTIARINYLTYMKFIWKYLLGLFGIIIVMLAIGGLIGGTIA